MDFFMVWDFYVFFLLKIIDCDYILYVIKGFGLIMYMYVLCFVWCKFWIYNNRNKIF